MTSELADPDSADTSASISTTVTPVADLSVTKSDSPDPLYAGEQLTYALTVHNAGPSSAGGVTLTDTLPSGVTFDIRHPLAGQLLGGERHGHLRASARSRTGSRSPSRSR